MVVVRRVWDRRQCPLLQPGDAIVKINGADVQSLTFSQVKHSHQSQKPALNTYCAVTTGFIFGIVLALRSRESYKNTLNKEMWFFWSTEEVTLRLSLHLLLQVISES